MRIYFIFQCVPENERKRLKERKETPYYENAFSFPNWHKFNIAFVHNV